MDHQTLPEVTRLVEKLSAAHQLMAILTPSRVSMMSGNDRCFVCVCTVHFGGHCPDTQCYGCDEFGHFVQDCPNKILSSGTPCHQDRCHSRHQYTHNQRDGSHSYYGPRHRRHFSRSQSHCHSHTSCSSSSHSSSPCHPSANGCPYHHLCHDTNKVTPYPTLATSPTDITHATLQTRAIEYIAPNIVQWSQRNDILGLILRLNYLN